jgi:hypothetical protein
MLQKKPSAHKREHPALQNMKFLSFFLLLWVIFALLDPDPYPDSEYGSGSASADPIEFGYNSDPGQPWWKWNGSETSRWWRILVGHWSTTSTSKLLPNLTVHFGYCVRHNPGSGNGCPICCSNDFEVFKAYILELKFCNYQHVCVIKLLKSLHITHITSDFRPLFHARFFGNVVWLGTSLFFG